MEAIDDCVERILHDLQSNDPFSENVCDFISDCVLKTLVQPLDATSLPGFKIDEFLQKKCVADANIQRRLKSTFNIDCDVGKVGSVFQKASFFDEILSSLTCIASGVEEAVPDSCAVSHPEAHRGTIGISPKFKQDCSLKTGHVGLDIEAVRRNEVLKLNASHSLVSNSRNLNASSIDKNCFRPIIKPPLTPSEFKLVNISAFLSLSSYCECCKIRLEYLKENYSSQKINLQSELVFNSDTSAFKPVTKLTSDNSIKIDSVFTTVDHTSSNASPVPLEITAQKQPGVEPTENPSPKTNDEKDQNGIEPLLQIPSLSLETLPASLLDKPDSSLQVSTNSSVLPESRDKISSDISDSLSNTNLRNKQDQLEITSNEKNQSRSIKNESVLTTKQVLDEIYDRYNENKKSQKKTKNLKERLETMSKFCRDNSRRGKKDFNYKSKDLSNTTKDKGLFSDLSGNKSKGKVKISEINPIQPPKLTHTDQSENIIPKKTLINDPLEQIDQLKQAVPFIVRKTVNLDTSSSKLNDEYIPLVVLDDDDEKEELVKRTEASSSRKVVQSDPDHRAMKKLYKYLKKERRKKRAKKVELDLAPPPGVDLDEFLQQQLEDIKSRLKNCDESDNKCNLPDLIKDQVSSNGAKSDKNISLAVTSAFRNTLCSLNRKVISFGEPSKQSDPILEEGEILQDHVKPSSKNVEKLKVLVSAHNNSSCIQSCGDDSKEFLEGRAHRNNQLKEKYENSIDLSGSDVSKYRNSNEHKSDKGNLIISEDPRNSRKWSRSPNSYSKHRFKSISRSPERKYGNRYSGSPSPHRRSPYKNRGYYSSKRRSRSFSPFRNRSRSASPRHRMRSRSPKNRHRSPKCKYRNKSRSPKSKYYNRSRSPRQYYKNKIIPPRRSDQSSMMDRHHPSAHKFSKSRLPHKLGKTSPKTNHPIGYYHQKDSSSKDDHLPLNSSPISDGELLENASAEQDCDEVIMLDPSPISEIEMFEEIETTTTVIEERTYSNFF